MEVCRGVKVTPLIEFEGPAGRFVEPRLFMWSRAVLGSLGGVFSVDGVQMKQIEALHA